MKNIFYENEFYSDLGDLLDALGIEDGKEHELPDDWIIVCRESNLEPLLSLTEDWIMERIDDERFTEEANEAKVVAKILRENIPFDKINALMPKLYYESSRELTITKDDVIEHCK